MATPVQLASGFVKPNISRARTRNDRQWKERDELKPQFANLQYLFGKAIVNVIYYKSVPLYGNWPSLQWSRLCCNICILEDLHTTTLKSLDAFAILVWFFLHFFTNRKSEGEIGAVEEIRLLLRNR